MPQSSKAVHLRPAAYHLNEEGGRVELNRKNLQHYIRTSHSARAFARRTASMLVRRGVETLGSRNGSVNDFPKETRTVRSISCLVLLRRNSLTKIQVLYCSDMSAFALYVVSSTSFSIDMLRIWTGDRV